MRSHTSGQSRGIKFWLIAQTCSRCIIYAPVHFLKNKFSSSKIYISVHSLTIWKSQVTICTNNVSMNWTNSHLWLSTERMQFYRCIKSSLGYYPFKENLGIIPREKKILSPMGSRCNSGLSRNYTKLIEKIIFSCTFPLTAFQMLAKGRMLRFMNNGTQRVPKKSPFKESLRYSESLKITLTSLLRTSVVFCFSNLAKYQVVNLVPNKETPMNITGKSFLSY